MEFFIGQKAATVSPAELIRNENNQYDQQANALSTAKKQQLEGFSSSRHGVCSIHERVCEVSRKKISLLSFVIQDMSLTNRSDCKKNKSNQPFGKPGAVKNIAIAA